MSKKCCAHCKKGKHYPSGWVICKESNIFNVYDSFSPKKSLRHKCGYYEEDQQKGRLLTEYKICKNCHRNVYENLIFTFGQELWDTRECPYCHEKQVLIDYDSNNM